jgi:hypothetical protein
MRKINMKFLNSKAKDKNNKNSQLKNQILSLTSVLKKLRQKK